MLNVMHLMMVSRQHTQLLNGYDLGQLEQIDQYSVKSRNKTTIV